MRLTTAAFCLIPLCATAAFGQDAFLFRGVYTVVSKNAACTGRNPVGDNGNIRLSFSADGKTSAFALYDPRMSQSFHLAGSRFATSYKRVQSLLVLANFAPVRHPVLVKFTQQKPAAISASTGFLSFLGSIKGYGSGVNCVVTFRASLTKNID